MAREDMNMTWRMAGLPSRTPPAFGLADNLEYGPDPYQELIRRRRQFIRVNVRRTTECRPHLVGPTRQRFVLDVYTETEKLGPRRALLRARRLQGSSRSSTRSPATA